MDAEQAAAAQLGVATGDGLLLRLSAAEKADAAVDAQSGSQDKAEDAAHADLEAAQLMQMLGEPLAAAFAKKL